MANKASKPVICATEIFDSMLYTPRPTNQEVSDIAKIVSDGADGILLSEETASGEHPDESVGFLSKICAEAERIIDEKGAYSEGKLVTSQQVTPSEALAASAVKTSLNMSIDLIVVHTQNGQLPRYLAKYKPTAPILACSDNIVVLRQLTTTRGIQSFLIPQDNNESLISQAVSHSKETGLCKSGRKVLYIHGMMDD